MKIPNVRVDGGQSKVSLARIVSEDSQRVWVGGVFGCKSSKDS